MTVCLLVRHAAHDLVDSTLVGRAEGVRLSDAGRSQAQQLSVRLRGFAIGRVQSSPRTRAVQTATEIAGIGGIPVEIHPALDEVDFGKWTGLAFEDLARDPAWRCWNSQRAKARAPGGESMHEAQARIVSHLQWLHETHASAVTVMVTHAEIIRAAILSAMSLPLDQWVRIDVPPASITRLQIGPGTHSVASFGSEMVVT